MRLDRGEREACTGAAPRLLSGEIEKCDETQQNQRPNLSQQKDKIGRRKREHRQPSVARPPRIAVIDLPKELCAYENNQRVKQEPSELRAAIIDQTDGKYKCQRPGGIPHKQRNRLRPAERLLAFQQLGRRVRITAAQ